MTTGSHAPVSADHSALEERIQWNDRFIPKKFRGHPDLFRQARLMIGFTGVGVFFGMAYILFYLLIGHYTGALVIAACILLLATVPLIMRGCRLLNTAGHWICLITMAGFTSLCLVEKGAYGHSIAWLASGSLIALLLLGRNGGLAWGIVGFVIVGVFCSLAFMGIRLPPTYKPEWETAITAGGYMGFVAFLFILGAIFEKWRAEAFASLEEARQGLAKANEHLVLVNDEKNEFLGVAAHDLRNPLSTIMMCGELMILKNEPTVTDEMSKRVVREAARMRDLIGALLDVNALETGRIEWKPTQVDILDLTKEVISMAELRAKEKQQTIHFQFDSEDPHMMDADRRALTQVLENLISNAIKFSHIGGEIFIQLSSSNQTILWRIQDNGPGFSDEDRTQLFRKFSKLSARPTGGENSSGLGLSIVKKFVDRLDGSIICEETDGTGAAFALEFREASAPVSQETTPVSQA